MRINKFVALATGLSRRASDEAIAGGRVAINGLTAEQGAIVADTDSVALDNKTITPAVKRTIMLNKPAGYVVSRDGQGSKTIYDLMPEGYHHLKPVGRLDKYSSGLLLLTNDGELANQLTHPSNQKTKIYEIGLDKPLEPLHHQMFVDYGVQLDDGSSKFDSLTKMDDDRLWQVALHEGRNRQIRRSFEALGYTVTKLHRTHFGPYKLGELKPGHTKEI